MALDPEQVFGICGLKLDAAVFDVARQCWFIELRSVAADPPCPTCGQPASRRHSAYWRTLADVPCAGHQTRWRLVVRRLVCQNVACPQRIFAERFGDNVLPTRSRQTARLECIVHHLGLALCGRPAASFARRLMMPASSRGEKKCG